MSLSATILNRILRRVKKAFNLPPDMDPGPLGDVRFLSRGYRLEYGSDHPPDKSADADEPGRPLTPSTRDTRAAQPRRG